MKDENLQRHLVAATTPHMQSDLVTPGLLTAHARIFRGDNGSEITLSELAAAGERPAVWILNETWTVGRESYGCCVA
jgi:hypothetical protein